MKKYILILLVTIVSFKSYSQQVVINPEGINFTNGKNDIIIENNKLAKESISQIVKNVKSKHQSQYIKIDTEDDVIIINDFIPGYTKTDKAAGSAYLLDLSYKITVDIKDNKYRVNAPIVNISANQKYDGHAVSVNQGVQFTIEMGIKGKRDMWSNSAKKLYIYDEKDKLIEKTTKEKLEKDLSKILNIIIDQSDKSDW
ncbi:hypothetical protein [Sphingobacterium bovisgrunnientis]|uniref:hypothetical protein n=1 Tax=Sphingobacterium bovisgrunnientis TaxID=1874697 RepID=UPI001357699B|nr:hypothetical protein [Sphingobacterium bovisgrunnientis]